MLSLDPHPRQDCACRNLIKWIQMLPITVWTTKEGSVMRALTLQAFKPRTIIIVLGYKTS